MANISKADFDFYKNEIYKDKDFHNVEFLQRIDPDLIDAYYEGDPDSEYSKGYTTPKRMSINRLFPTTVTLLPSLYPQNFKFMCSAKPSFKGRDIDIKISESGMNYYREQMNMKTPNEKAIMSAWLYGFGTVKQGYKTVFVKNTPAPVDNSNKGMLEKFGDGIKKIFTGSPSMEKSENPEYIDKEYPFIEFVNSKNLYLDRHKPFGEGLAVTQYIQKTLYDITNQGLYDIDNDDFKNRFARGEKDTRDIFLDVYERWFWMKDAIYVFVMCDGYEKPLRYDKFASFSEGFPYKFLAFNTQVNRTYPISHIKVAQRLERLSQYILTLQKEAIEKYRDIGIWSGDAFEESERSAISANKMGTNVFTKKGIPPGASFQHASGVNIPQELFAVQQNVDNNIKEILSIVGARVSGTSEMETLGQEQIADFGNQLRNMGFQDKIRDFLVSQGRKLHQDLKQFATAPVLLNIAGLDLVNPMTGEQINEKTIEFGPNTNPQYLKDIIPAELNIDIDVSEQARRDIAVVRKQLNEYVQGMVLPLLPLLNQQGKTFDAEAFLIDGAKNFETLSNPEKYIKELPMPPQMPGNAPGMPPGAPGMPQPPGMLPLGQPTPESLAAGAGGVPQPGV